MLGYKASTKRTINKFHTFSHREQNNNPIYQSDPEYQIEDHRGDIT